MDLISMLSDTYKKYRFTDFHIHPDEPPLIRVDSEIKRTELPPIPNAQAHELLMQVMSEKNIKELETRLEIDFAISIKDVCRFRVNAYYQDGKICGVFRAIPFKVATLEQLGLPDVLKTIVQRRQGLVLVTGQKGSGKTTTLAAMLEYVNQTAKKHIITIEDPIEYVYENKNSFFSQRQVETDTRSFASALRGCLREDADIILVGEIRDIETIRLALTAAETGQLVLSTLHTHNAITSINRIIDFFHGKEKVLIRKQVSFLLQAVISQSLVKRVSGGRVLAHEIMLATPAIRNLIREENMSEIRAAIESDRQLGMHTLDQHIQTLLKQNLISPETAQQYLSTDMKLAVSYEKEVE